MSGVVKDSWSGKWFARVNFRGQEYGLLRSNSEREARTACREAQKYLDANPRTFRAQVKRIRQEHRKRIKRQCTSRYPGVSYNKQADKWRAYCILSPKRRVHIGSFPSELTAHKARLKFMRGQK